MSEKHTCNLCLENFQDSLNKMENKIDSLCEDFDAVTSTRKTQDEPSSSSQTTRSKILRDNMSDISNNELELLLTQLKETQSTNNELVEKNTEQKQYMKELESEKDEYRSKYFNTQILLEEKNQQVEILNRTTQNMQEKINLGLQQAENRFSAELAELRILPSVLHTKQEEIKELNKQLAVSEKTVNLLSTDLESCIVKYEILSKSLEDGQNESAELIHKLNAKGECYARLEQKCNDYQDEICQLNKRIMKIPQLEETIGTQSKEIKRLLEQIEILKTENARHVNRLKERAANQYHEKVNEIVEYENDVVKLRATLNTIAKERDEMRYHLQLELSNLSRKFAEAQHKIQLLKGHVDLHQRNAAPSCQLHVNEFESY